MARTFHYMTGTCRNCGGNKYHFDEKEQTFVCEYCGTEVYVEEENPYSERTKGRQTGSVELDKLRGEVDQIITEHNMKAERERFRLMQVDLNRDIENDAKARLDKLMTDIDRAASGAPEENERKLNADSCSNGKRTEENKRKLNADIGNNNKHTEDSYSYYDGDINVLHQGIMTVMSGILVVFITFLFSYITFSETSETFAAMLNIIKISCRIPGLAMCVCGIVKIVMYYKEA